MQIASYSFETLDWEAVPLEEHIGDAGKATWQVKMVNDIRVRKVVYSPGYISNHWCSKGHILLCLQGEMETKLEDGRVFTLTAGMSYFVGDNNEAHRSSTTGGCVLFMVD